MYSDGKSDSSSVMFEVLKSAKHITACMHPDAILKLLNFVCVKSKTLSIHSLIIQRLSCLLLGSSSPSKILTGTHHQLQTCTRKKSPTEFPTLSKAHRLPSIKINQPNKKKSRNGDREIAALERERCSAIPTRWRTLFYEAPTTASTKPATAAIS